SKVILTLPFSRDTRGTAVKAGARTASLLWQKAGMSVARKVIIAATNDVFLGSIVSPRFRACGRCTRKGTSGFPLRDRWNGVATGYHWAGMGAFGPPASKRLSCFWK